MKICFIADAAAIHTQRWVRWFADEHEPIVISTGEDDGLAEFKVAALPTEAKPGARLASSLMLVRKVIAEEEPDLVHCHFINEAGWFGAAAARHRPLVVTAWGSDVYRAPHESRLARRLNPWAVRRADWVTCDSADQAKVLRSWGAANVSVIGWGVDRREFHPGVDGGPLRRRLDIPADAPVLLSPRRWHPNSNIPSVVAAHARLADDVYLILKRGLGNESDGGPAVERAVAASPARDRIRTLGDIPAGELPALYGAADVVISLCSTDGTPVSVLEAMAVGAPVVALDVPSVAEWVTPPGGALVPALDPDLIASAVESFLGDPSRRAQAAAHNVGLIGERADRDLELERMGALYERLAVAP